MKIFYKKQPLIEELKNIRANSLSIGFVPTMGALHKGHLSLVKRSFTENDVTVVSIFVNPAQFNERKDFEKYPRIIENDIALLQNILTEKDIVFNPDEYEMYPEPDTRIFDFGTLDKVMEGKYRKGHFNGVAQIVSKFFNLIRPDKAYFGEKDFQQLTIIKKLVEQMDLPIKIVECPIVRETDGLAMSSRNLLLNPSQRKSAPLIFRTLSEAKNKKHSMLAGELIKWVTDRINSDNELKVEYFSIVDSQTLIDTTEWEENRKQIGCIAVWAGEVRLIDNISF
ncbi:MAG: pantoate--beta-alanine ligase [Bacteroidia bacterium]|nr:pantoate--beta-alanine ligase [Bacteroidia bacterium]